MSARTYPQGRIQLDGTSGALDRLDRYQRRRVELLAARGVTEVLVDTDGAVHALLPATGRRVKVRRPRRRIPQAYYGTCLGGWITAVQHAHQIHPTGWAGIFAAQCLLHEAWPKVAKRHKPSPGDRAAERIVKVL